jgi:uncharacterized protein
MKAFLILVLLLMISVNIHGQTVSDGIVIPNTSEYILRSEINHVTYRLSISLPEHYSDSLNKKFPVLFFLDGNVWLPLGSSVMQCVNKADAIVPVILIGIGYEVNTFDYDVVQRTYDYTPTQNNAADSGMSFRYNTEIRSGGADTFLLILEQEILPFIDSLFRTNGNRTIAGHSLGGLFATYVMLENPRLFSNYIIASPALWWDDDILLLQFREKKNIILPSGKILLGVGRNETERMRNTAYEFDKLLRKRIKARKNYRFDFIDDCNHFTVIPVLLERGLLFLFSEGQEK